VDRVVLVPDDAIREAQEVLWRDVHVVAEPGGAASLAAVLCGAYEPSWDERVVALICGGNTDPGSLSA
jgi:threonine dehydratase